MALDIWGHTRAGNVRRVLVCLVSLAAVLALAWGGTLAYFLDTETSTGNTFTAGTLNLKIKDGGLDWSDGIGAEWTLADMKPGHQAYGSVDLINVGSIPAGSLAIAVTYTILDPLGPEADTQENTPAAWMASWMEITRMEYYVGGGPSVNIIAGNLIGDVDGDGRANTLKDLAELNGGAGVTGLPPPGQTLPTRATLDMTIKFREDAGNDFQGDTLKCTFTFTLNQ